MIGCWARVQGTRPQVDQFAKACIIPGWVQARLEDVVAVDAFVAFWALLALQHMRQAGCSLLTYRLHTTSRRSYEHNATATTGKTDLQLTRILKISMIEQRIKKKLSCRYGSWQVRMGAQKQCRADAYLLCILACLACIMARQRTPPRESLACKNEERVGGRYL